MSVKILVFDYRETEKEFFANNKFDNYEIRFFDFSLCEENLHKIPEEDIDNAFVISVFIESNITPNVVNMFKNLRIISTRSTGFDHICKTECEKRNIIVINVQNYGETPVAEFTFALILALTRKIIQANSSIKNNLDQLSFVGKNLKNMTIGVVGTGAIGAAVCKIANAFDMKILAYDLKEKTEIVDKYQVNYVTLSKLISESDIITLHLPYTADNYQMFAEKEFSMMKQNSFFINVSRGELVDLKFLKENLERGKILGAGLDVVACDASDDCQKFGNKLEISSLKCLQNSLLIKEMLKMPNVIITPHIAYETEDAINYILRETFDSITDIIKGGSKNRVI